MARIGETLREARERRGLTIEQVAQETRISARFVEALEEERFEELPAPVYVRGFLRSYANFLRIDPQPLLDQLVGGEPGLGAGPPGFVGGPREIRERPVRRRADPFRRSGNGEPGSVEGDGWAPERPMAVAPSGPPPMEPPSYSEELNPDPFGFERGPRLSRRAVGGVLLERPEVPGEGGLPRALVLAALGVGVTVVVLAAVAIARGGGGGGSSPGAAPDAATRTLTPGAVVPVGSVTGTASPRATGTGAATPSVSATVVGTVTPGASPTGTMGPSTPTPGGSSTATPTLAPTATPTPLPPTPTPTPLPPRPSGLQACDLRLQEGKCGPSPARVICFPPFPADLGIGTNSNWFVDVSRSYPLQPGWREVWVEYGVSVGPLIDVGQHGCE